MPKRSWFLFIVVSNELSLSISFLQRSSQRSVRSQASFAYFKVAGFFTHSSKAIAMVEPKCDCICILCSGPINILLPSTCELKTTPSSLILLSFARLNTWNPPLSVKIGLSQLVNLCKPPISYTRSSPGRTWRWYVLQSITWQPIFFKSSVESPPFIAAEVATFIKAGVCTVPWTVSNCPLLAVPSCFNNVYLAIISSQNK